MALTSTRDRAQAGKVSLENLKGRVDLADRLARAVVFVVDLDAGRVLPADGNRRH
jgi:hypothetical protein